MYKFIKIRHDAIEQCHGNYKEMKKINNKLEIFRKSMQINLGVLRGSFLFKGLGVQKGTQTPCWLRPWFMISVSSVYTQKLIFQMSEPHLNRGGEPFKEKILQALKAKHV